MFVATSKHLSTSFHHRHQQFLFHFPSPTTNLNPRRHFSDFSQPKYEGHLPTNFFQKALLTVGSAVMGVVKPERVDLIATLGETTGEPTLRWMKEKMKGDEVGREILRDRPSVKNLFTPSFIEEMSALPENTFGKQFIEWMKKEGFQPGDRPSVHFVDDPDLAYIMTRYRENHDYLHVLVGLPPDVLSEILVKWIEMFQTGLPMCALSSFVGPIRLNCEEQAKFRKMLPFAIQNGRNAKFYMNVYFEKHFHDDVTTLRNQLGFNSFPV
eukprot:TRINITY_DN12513_c0_g1_i1.p1 TRINITY_DN12513_c0_g1~~TRINITY_DN12513_c0_g1_i1.p1  ORF type:complete len:268 (+),score=70.04 TRINITY_DN12513_c0_g1_i1:102-905(+)